MRTPGHYRLIPSLGITLKKILESKDVKLLALGSLKKESDFFAGKCGGKVEGHDGQEKRCGKSGPPPHASHINQLAMRACESHQVGELHKKRGRETLYTKWVPVILGIGNSLVWSGNMVLCLKYPA